MIKIRCLLTISSRSSPSVRVRLLGRGKGVVRDPGGEVVILWISVGQVAYSGAWECCIEVSCNKNKGCSGSKVLEDVRKSICQSNVRTEPLSIELIDIDEVGRLVLFCLKSEDLDSTLA